MIIEYNTSILCSLGFLLGLKDIVIVVRSQHNSFHVKKAKAMREDLSKQAELLMGQKVRHCA